MAGQLTIDTLKASSGVLATQNGMTGIAKAWVTYKSTSAQAIRSSFNVSSVTYNGTGDFTINFATVMADTNYCTVGMGGTSSTVGYSVISNYSSVSTPTTAACRIRTYSPAYPSNVDGDYVGVAIFGA